MAAPKQHPHNVKITGAIQKFPGYAIRYSKCRTKAFVYYLAEMEPVVIAHKPDNSNFWSVDGKKQRELADVLRHAQDVVSSRRR